MNPTHTFSIIMPIYNASETLCEAIRSVINQTYQDWELLLIDDGSQDGSLLLGKLIANSDERIRSFGFENAGPSAARNRGLGLAKGDYIAFLDADDTWHPDRLAGFAQAFDDQIDAGVLFSRTQFVDVNLQNLRTVTPFFPDLKLEVLLAENPVCSTSNIACRREVIEQIGGFTDGLDFAEDQDWLVRVAANGRWQIRGLDKVWFYYRSTSDSQSSELDAMQEGWTHLATKAEELAGGSISAIKTRAYAVFCRQLARRALRKSDASKEALKWLNEALRADPKLILRQPRRTLLTTLGVLISFLPFSQAKELVSQ